MPYQQKSYKLPKKKSDGKKNSSSENVLRWYFDIQMTNMLMGNGTLKKIIGDFLGAME